MSNCSATTVCSQAPTDRFRKKPTVETIHGEDIVIKTEKYVHVKQRPVIARKQKINVHGDKHKIQTVAVLSEATQFKLKEHGNEIVTNVIMLKDSKPHMLQTVVSSKSLIRTATIPVMCESRKQLTDDFELCRNFVKTTGSKAINMPTVPVEITKTGNLGCRICCSRYKIDNMTRELFDRTPAVVTYFTRQDQRQEETVTANQQTQIQCSQFHRHRMNKIKEHFDCKQILTSPKNDVKLNKKQLVRKKVIIKLVIKKHDKKILFIRKYSENNKKCSLIRSNRKLPAWNRLHININDIACTSQLMNQLTFAEDSKSIIHSDNKSLYTRSSEMSKCSCCCSNDSIIKQSSQNSSNIIEITKNKPTRYYHTFETEYMQQPNNKNLNDINKSQNAIAGSELITLFRGDLAAPKDSSKSNFTKTVVWQDTPKHETTHQSSNIKPVQTQQENYSKTISSQSIVTQDHSEYKTMNQYGKQKPHTVKQEPFTNNENVPVPQPTMQTATTYIIDTEDSNLTQQGIYPVRIQSDDKTPKSTDKTVKKK